MSRHSSMHIAPPAEALKTRGDIDGDGDDDDAEEEIDEHAFDHPSTYKPAPWIWVPKDNLGFSDIVLEELREAGVDASDLGAFMNEKARVKVTYVHTPYLIYVTASQWFIIFCSIVQPQPSGASPLPLSFHVSFLC